MEKLKIKLPENLDNLGTVIVLMEDDESCAQDIVETIKRCGFIARQVKSKEDAVRLAKEEKQRNFIFDMHMGKDRDHEGLDALEIIKEYDRKAFVGILSGYLSTKA